MLRIKDRIFLGILSGLIGSIPGRLLNAVEYNRGIVDAKYGQMAAGLFINKNKADTPAGKLLGSVANELLAASTGISVTYTLAATGRDNAVLKGMGVGSLYWFLLYGLSAKLGDTPKSKKTVSPLLSLADHLIFGTLAGVVTATIGDDSLFPDGQVKSSHNKLPLVYSK